MGGGEFALSLLRRNRGKKKKKEDRLCLRRLGEGEKEKKKGELGIDRVQRGKKGRIARLRGKRAAASSIFP